jgi:diguanylate cyclase (GGDEF)-like protein/PAS domain S-box-containing protein
MNNQDTLEFGEEMWQNVIQNLPDIVVLLDSKLNPIYVNQPGRELCIFPTCSLAKEHIITLLKWVWDQGGEYTYEAIITDPTGVHQYFENRVVKLNIIGLQKAVLLITCHNISHRKHLEQQWQLAAQVFTHAREGIFITDVKGNILDVNEAFCQITGYERQEVLGKNPRFLQSGRHSPEFYAQLWHDLLNKRYWQGEIWNRRKQGNIYAELLTISAIDDDQNQVQRYVALFSDITPHKEYQQQIEHLAYYDALTDLPNRLLLSDRLHHAMAQVERTHQHLVVVYIDLDGFKEINDSHGHEVGDQVLVTLAQRMKQSLRVGDTIARMGGDEFVAVIYPTEAHLWLVVLNRLLYATSQPIQLDSLLVQVSASLGVTFYPPGGEVSLYTPGSVDADQLLRQADQAMYQAKLMGKNCYQIYNPEQDRHIQYQYQKRKEIYQALSRQEFILHYQPKVNMQTGQVIGVEALIRWQHPEKGLLYPGQFLPFIEQDIINANVGEWVIDTVLDQIEVWQNQGYTLPVSVNVSGLYLQQENFLPHLETLLALHPNIPAQCLELEILETSALKDIQKVSQMMQDCERLGIHFSLDDFGTGYSSLIHLKHLPATYLKIDKSFVRDILIDPEDLAILEGVLGMANAFHQEVIAEGVETIAQGILLIQLGCHLGQGYAITPPLPGEALLEWIRTWKTHHLWMEQSSFHFDDFPLLFVKVEHQSWIKTLHDYLHDGTGTMPWIPPPSRCRFCHWLKRHEQLHYHAQTSFIDLKNLHQRIHENIAIILANPQGDHSANLMKLQEFQYQFAALLNTLRL